MLPYGIHFIVGLMTALRLGLVISVLPLKDRFFSKMQLENGLKALHPDLVVSTGAVPESLNLDLSLEKSSSSPLEPHAYKASEMAQILYGEPITSIEATRSYLIPLRDGLIALNLKQSSCWAKPFSSMYHEEPSCTLMALLAGATIFYVSETHLHSNPKALENQAIDIMGVSHPLQQLWLKNPGCPKLKFWYRNPLIGTDRNWKAFSEINNLEKIPASQLLIDIHKGGVTLASQPKTVEIPTFLHPSLGSPWKLLKAGRKGELSCEGFGLFHVEPENGTPQPLVISQISDEWCVSTTTFPLREGVPYPFEYVENAVKTLDLVQTCMVLP